MKRFFISATTFVPFSSKRWNATYLTGILLDEVHELRSSRKFITGTVQTGILLFLVIFLLGSCKKSGNAEFEDDPVVEAYLAPGQKISVVISEKIPYDENTVTGSTDLNSLNIRVGRNGNYFNLAPLGNGVYSDTAGNIPVFGDSTYTLSFIFNGVTVTSTTVIPPKPEEVTQSVTTIKMSQIDPDDMSGTDMPAGVTIKFTNADESYYLATVESLDTTQGPVFKDSVPESTMCSTMPVTGTQVRIEPMRIPYFGKNRIILYHINSEYSTFFMQQISTTQNYQAPPSNIENGLGIFTGVNADTLFLSVIQVK